MSYFNPAYINFFKELSKNNHKEWFDENRKTYQKEVKEPFTAFVEEMIARIREHDPEVQIEAKDAIFRINNDIRFAKDKPLYKTGMSANISRYGRKDKAYPGFYFEFSPEAVRVFGGAYMVENSVLQIIRHEISEHPEAFTKAYSNSDFKNKYVSVQGDQHKRLPKEFQPVAEKEPLIANKQFYYRAELSPDLILSEELPDILMEYYRAGEPLNTFLMRAFRK